MVLLIILHTKSKSQLKHILPSSKSIWRISLSPMQIQKKEELSLLSLLSHKNMNATPNKLIYRYHFQALSKTLSKFEGYAYLSVYHFGGRIDERGRVLGKEGNASQRPHPQLKNND